MKGFTLLIGFYWVKIVLIMYIGFNQRPPGLTDHLFLLFSILGPLLIAFSLPLFLPKRFQQIGFLFTMFFISFWIFAHLLYYRFYEDFMTLTILLQIGNVGGLSRSTWELFSLWDLLFFVDIAIAGWLLLKKEKFMIPAFSKKRYLGMSVTLTGLTMAAALIYKPYVVEENYNRSQLVQTMSLFTYQTVDIGQSLSAPVYKWMAGPDDVELMETYVQEQSNEATEWFGEAEGMNVVMIALESVQNFVIDLDVEGEEVTPFLNRIKQESFYFSNVYEQTAQGKSSDAEFMVDTGLYPLDGGAVFVRRPENTYNGLPEILKSYQSNVFHGNDETFWNRSKMYEALGYDHFYSEKDYYVTEENSVNYGLKDHQFFEQSISMIKEMEIPYLAKFITLTNHFPFLLDDEDQDFQTNASSEPIVNRYLSTVHYLDKSLESFFERLKEEEMYENTIFVLYGDHYGISSEYENGLNELIGPSATPLSRMENKRVPVLIHIPGLKGNTVDKVAGQIDIRATVLHLLGEKTEEYMSFGENLLNENRKGMVVFRNGDYISESTMYTNGQCYEIDHGNQLEEEECEAERNQARDELHLSDLVIKGDWLRFKKK
ncbi:LTA synthase family protein [Jeotgalibacillus proteolyticus]|uniref:LTA synthase family protein n=1 Tax=Jeotgalibacillus proteolyticus TaxID=2082395 RepID=A0A2S5GDD3_9BACL|nr:LTA synthase family protein [Jeotgalibacillus proteolyticus]PPA71047.1 LTA synthase family protein [Jeotgalibacillus proteolyticus]